MSAKPRIVLLFGGRSSEHEISCVTASGVLSAIDRDRFDVVAVGITKSGVFVHADEQVSSFALDATNMPHVVDNGTRILWPDSPMTKQLSVEDESGNVRDLGDIDLVFPVLHGPFGEDGTLQGMLDMLGIGYVGSGVLASALCMDKHFTKTVLSAAGLAVAPWRRIHLADHKRDSSLGQRILADLGLPVFVKPSRAGSSVGVSKVASVDELDAALSVAFEADSTVLIEAAIRGREIELAVLGSQDGATRVSDVAGEIVFTGREFYDYEAKYLGGSGVELSCPAVVTARELDALRVAAAKAFDALGCDDLARVDFFLTEDGPVINEINTLPGFTPISMFPRLWHESGLSYQNLVTELIELALRRSHSVKS
jgi:D-alanine-D-alanine ligase